jgi:glycosyltransferase involved in cell wall biosynthesis
MPKISFVLPTYNRVAWLAECIDSLLKQTETDIEIIVVDDCSKDSTEELMDFYTKKDKRIVYVRNNENKGAGESRNIGNRIASADIICVCDSDDYYPNYRAKETLKFFKKNSKYAIMNGSYYRVDYSSNIIQEFPSRPFDEKAFKNKGEIYFCHPSCAYKKEDILAIPYRKETKEMTDDFQLLTDFISAGKKIKNVKEVLCFHRVLPNSMMTEMRGGSLE